MPLPHRQNLLFLGAVLLPSLLLIALGIRTVRQEDELAGKRLRDQHAQAIGLLRQELLTRLESRKLRPGTDAALVARIQNGKVILPWQSPSPLAAQYLDQLPASAEKLLHLPPAIIDEYGVPIALYAARRLNRPIDLGDATLSPAAAHMLADLCPPGPCRAHALDRARNAETAERLAALPLPPESAWQLFGRPPWFVSRTSDTLIAIAAKPILDSLRLPPNAHWNLEDTTSGEPIAPELPGLRLVAPLPAAPRAGSTQTFYLAGILLAVLLTGFTAWLLHRDIRRESHLALLRAQFVSSVSHELRTPIATIRAFAELLDLGRVSSETEKSEYVKNILGESERLTRLIDGVLEFSRIEQGNRAFNLRPTSLPEVLRSAARALAYPLSQGRFDLQMNIAPNLPDIPADRDALEQAVQNLLANAIKYSGDGRQIELSVAIEAPHAVVRVRDHGIGIPLADQSRIFERFYRAPLPDGHQVAGAGLGLALVDKIVQAHGGRVTVDSTPDQGSTFAILLPIPNPS